MRISHHLVAAPAVVALVLAGVAAARTSQPSTSLTGTATSVQAPGRRIDVGVPAVSPLSPPGATRPVGLATQLDSVGLDVTLTNTGSGSLPMRSDNFNLEAEGDMLGQTTPFAAVSLPPAGAMREHLTFVVPAAALPELALLYHPAGTGIIASIPLHLAKAQAAGLLGARTVPSATSTVSHSSAGNKMATATNTASTAAGGGAIEDTFARPDQAGWGTSTNPDGLPNVAWGMDGDGTHPAVTISAGAGAYAYPGAVNLVGIAAAGSTAYSGGDALAELSLSAVGHVTPYVVEDACADKSCYYGARLHTSQGLLELARRSGGATTVLASVPFTAAANTAYWLRLDVAAGASDTLQAKVWAAGSPEPAGWAVTAADSKPLAANLAGAGGSWDQVGTGESIRYTCYAHAAGLAASCTPPSGSPTPSATATGTATNTATATNTGTPTGTPSATPTTGGDTSTPTASASPTGTSTPTDVPNGSAIEDNFARADQTGWGTSTNPDGLPNVAWGMDGDGTHPAVAVSGGAGVYGYPGAVNLVGIASSGAATYNGGDALAELSLSAAGHVTPYVVEDACADKSCYYGARLHTSQGLLELARRSGGATAVLASAPFAAAAGTLYWLRLDVAPGPPATLRARVWAAGSSEPSSWAVTATDGSPLAANLAGAGGSWDQLGTGESIRYACYAHTTSGLAAPCTPPSGTPTATPTATGTPTGTPTPATITEHTLSGGVGEPWGTAVDAAGNIWFAEAGCDFAPTCSSSAPIGQIGEYIPASGTLNFYSLPNITGNQPIFVALDSNGMVWFTTPNNSMLGEFNPTTKSFIGQWPVTAGSGPWDLTIVGGTIWYTEHLASAIGAFDTVAHTFTDFQTPSSNTQPYGIAAAGNLVWFTENNDTVARIAKLDTANNNQISEYPIRAQLPSGQFGLTPHLLALDAQGHPWWSEGWVRALGTLDPSVATPGQCTGSGTDCAGVSEFALPAPPSTCNSGHVSGIAIQGGGSLIWTDDSLSNQVGSYNPASNGFNMNALSCGVHPHDGLNLGAFTPPALPHVWWDEEFGNALGELIQ